MQRVHEWLVAPWEEAYVIVLRVFEDANMGGLPGLVVLEAGALGLREDGGVVLRLRFGVFSTSDSGSWTSFMSTSSSSPPDGTFLEPVGPLSGSNSLPLSSSSTR